MPTFAKLVAAAGFAVLFFIVSQMAVPLFGTKPLPLHFLEVNVAIGALMGWRVCGGRAGRGYMGSISSGLTALVAALFWIFLLHGFSEMILRAMDLRYKEPIGAVVSGFGISLDLAVLCASPEIIATVLGGAILIGLFCEMVSRKVD